MASDIWSMTILHMRKVTIKDAVTNFIKSPVAVTTETMYLDWETPFPAIAFCISTSKKIKTDYSNTNPGMLPNNFKRALFKTSAEDLLLAYEGLKAPCADFLAECSWNNVKFNCCTEFQELKKTGIGYCVAMNTYHLKKTNQPSVRFFINRTVKYGDLIIDFKLNAKAKEHSHSSFTVHVLNNLQLPMLTNIEKDEIRMKRGSTTPVQFIMYDTFNEDGVKYVPIMHRNCRFMYENRVDSLFDIYSSDSCYLQMIIERMIKFCGCVHFYYIVPSGARVCNGSEMRCIIANKTEIMSKSEKLEQCNPNCEGTSLIINRMESSEYDSLDRSSSRVHVILLSQPVKRYRRYVVNDILDVIVAVGSAFGLFMGVSILSFFEIPYWFFIRRDKLENNFS
ncbi:pickpocket 13 isoform X2 [Megachile rotundata]|uniref:pickpocket 13 isoform X2 n=1 Tax=Megachile rotundata TaxID=143995 RepID=UPI000614D7F0|nr:PREDICTED: sodium channel protein Nach isoform X2 [Megachile rotundata]XP_012152041.1 PREDICTED: sodium channel protein Nach isoform X2 [Megachile rotundata]